MTTAKAKEVADLALKFQTWNTEIRKRVLERRVETQGLVIAALSKSHHLQLGPPGIGKSFLVTTGLSMIEGAKTMEILLHGYSQMEDMYGPISLKALKDDHNLRKTESYVPWADFVFADEVFKANPTLLQTNLWAFNERKFRNDGKVEPIPLISAFFASNEGPEDPTLQAFDDRIHLRFQVAPIREASTRLAMFRNKLANLEAPDPVLSIDDIRRAHEFVYEIEVPDFVLGALNDLFEELGKDQIVPTDRKMNDALGIIQATALYNGRATATVDDMSMLAHVFWTNEKDRPVVSEKVTDLANPIDKEATSLRNDIEALAREVEDIVVIEAKAVRIRRSVDQHDKLEEANSELLQLKARAKAEGVKSEVLQEAKARLHSVTERLLTKGFRYDKTASQLDKDELMRLIQESREARDLEDAEVEADG